MAGNGGMQETYDEPMLPHMNDALTVGGHHQITNGDEDDQLAATVENTPARSGDLSNEDDSHVQGIYKTLDFAGS